MKVTLQRIRLNRGGYDRSGAYWGIGSPLYVALTTIDDNEESYHFRARDRKHAKEIVLTNWKSRGQRLIGATFYN